MKKRFILSYVRKGIIVQRLLTNRSHVPSELSDLVWDSQTATDAQLVPLASTVPSPAYPPRTVSATPVSSVTPRPQSRTPQTVPPAPFVPQEVFANTAPEGSRNARPALTTPALKPKHRPTAYRVRPVPTVKATTCLCPLVSAKPAITVLPDLQSPHRTRHPPVTIP